MHNAQNMSHANITIPVTVRYLERTGHLEAVSLREFLKNRETAEFHFYEDKSLAPNGLFGPWELRHEFLSCPPDEWQGFIAMAGCFGPALISQRIFEQWQNLLREALLRPAQEWRALEREFGRPRAGVLGGGLTAPLKIAFDWAGETPQAVIFAQTALDAIIATIQIDKLTGAEFRVCSRHDCKSPPFRVEARQKIFCSSDCAHLVAVRNSRARAAAAKSKGTKRAPNGKRRG